MYKLMKRAGVRMKKIEICNVPTRKEARVEEFEDKTVALDKKLYELYTKNQHVLFLDEAIFKSRDFRKKAWSNYKQNLAVEDRTPK